MSNTPINLHLQKDLITYMMTTLWMRMRIPLCEMHVHGIRHGTHVVGLSYWPASIIIHWAMPLPWHYPAFAYMKQQKVGVSCVWYTRDDYQCTFFQLEAVGRLTMKICDNVLSMVQLLSVPKVSLKHAQTLPSLQFWTWK
jgi:hypothetical protein